MCVTAQLFSVLTLAETFDVWVSLDSGLRDCLCTFNHHNCMPVWLGYYRSRYIVTVSSPISFTFYCTLIPVWYHMILFITVISYYHHFCVPQCHIMIIVLFLVVKSLFLPLHYIGFAHKAPYPVTVFDL